MLLSWSCSRVHGCRLDRSYIDGLAGVWKEEARLWFALPCSTHPSARGSQCTSSSTLCGHPTRDRVEVSPFAVCLAQLKCGLVRSCTARHTWSYGPVHRQAVSLSARLLEDVKRSRSLYGRHPASGPSHHHSPVRAGSVRLCQPSTPGLPSLVEGFT